MVRPLAMMVLRLLSQQPLNGYALMGKVQAATGKRPSAGSIYPLLDQLKQDGHVSVKQDARRRNYTITAAGKDALAMMQHSRDEALEQALARLHIVCAATHTAPEAEALFGVLRSMTANEKPLAQYEHDLADFKRQFLLAIAGATDAGAIRTILRDATTKLRKVRQ